MPWLTAGCVRCSLAAAGEAALRRHGQKRLSPGAAWRWVGMRHKLSYHNDKTINLTRPGRRGLQEIRGGSMSTKRLTIFDTTLRDGEQAPGFSLRIDEKLSMARQLAALGVDVIEAGFPIASEADAEAVRLVATAACSGPSSPALARCTPADIDRAGWALEPARAAAHPRLHRHLRPAPRAQAAHHARGLPRRRGGRGAPRRAATPTTCSSRRRTRRAATWTSSAASSKRSSRPAARPSTCRTRSATRRPTRSATFFTHRPRARLERGPRGLQRALPRRSRAGGREHAGGAVRPARGRWSARSTASASAPATPRSKRS